MTDWIKFATRKLEDVAEGKYITNFILPALCVRLKDIGMPTVAAHIAKAEKEAKHITGTKPKKRKSK